MLTTDAINQTAGRTSRTMVNVPGHMGVIDSDLEKAGSYSVLKRMSRLPVRDNIRDRQSPDYFGEEVEEINLPAVTGWSRTE